MRGGLWGGERHHGAGVPLSLGVPWVGLCWNQVHARWLNYVVHRSALEEIVQKVSSLHEQDLAKLVNAHFSGVLPQIHDSDEMAEESSDDEGAAVAEAAIAPS